MSQSKWDHRYLQLAKLVSKWSKDPRAQVGAVVVRNNRVVATGFNGFPSEVLDRKERLADKEMKLQMVVHAEENALLVAGRSAEGAEIYVHGKPVCPRCAGSIIQAKIKRVIGPAPQENSDSQWDTLGQISISMFVEAGVQFHGLDLRKSRAAHSDEDKKAAAQRVEAIIPEERTSSNRDGQTRRTSGSK